MIKNYLKLVLMIAPALLLLCWVGVISAQIYSGREVTVAIRGYDPRSLLSGHYIQYTIDWGNTDCSQFESGVCPERDFEYALYHGYWGNNGRFYVSEKEAQSLDKAVRSGANKAEIIYSYRKGARPYALRLLINGHIFQANKN
ncbi:MAG: GDYXXLXY domain-containing protein [Alphaproteobacteria bacterium]|nr:GDYXXLXY domain-containing protein [Alphaproteobacteria bacterium]